MGENGKPVKQKIEHAEWLFSTILEIPQRLNPIEAKIVLNELYETRYGIFDHLSPEAKQYPLLSVGIHPAESGLDGMFEQVCDLYLDKKIKDLFGYDLDRFLQLPKHRIQSLFKIADRRNAKQHQADQAAQATLSNLGNQGKK